jgi:Flp pilus assembly protein TadD
MRIQTGGRLKTVLVLIVAGLMAVYGQVLWAADLQEPTGEVGATKTNAAAAEKLSKMDPREIATLDALMAHALTLYYDREFALALPIFKELADKAETMDIMFWLGTSAAKTGENELAIEKFQKMLTIDPDLYRVRLDLASVYFSMGRYDEARKAANGTLFGPAGKHIGGSWGMDAGGGDNAAVGIFVGDQQVTP